MRLAIAITAAFAVAASQPGGCSGGAAGKQAIQDPWEAACAGHACGEGCDSCPPGTPPETCPVPTFAATACNVRGQCVTAGTFVCAPGQTCEGQPCGVSCDAWCPYGAPCPAPAVCDGAGACVGETMDACNHGACAGKACGDECHYSLPCHHMEPPCLAPEGLGRCDARGICMMADEPPVCAPPPPDPCEGKICGETCDLCGGMCMHPAATACDSGGACVPVTPWICYDPCVGKACGEACTACPPDATDCYETMELKACDPDGRCVSRTPSLACPP